MSMAGEGEEHGAVSPYQELKTDVDRLCEQLEALLAENSALDPSQQLPVTEFTLNPRRLAALQEKLVNMELSVVRSVERSRLEKLLQCHYLKEAAWDSMVVKARSLSCICSDVKVRNYPITAPGPGTWSTVLEVVASRLREVEASKNMDTLSNIAMKAGVWRKTLLPGEGKTPPNSTSRSPLNESIPKGILDLDKTDFRTPVGRVSEEVVEEEKEETEEEEDEVEDGEPVLGEEEYRRLLYPQTELICRNRVERQLVLITFLTRRLRESFNKRFDTVHQRKERVIEEIKRLTRKRSQLKEELAKIREEGEGEGGLSRTQSREEQKEEEDKDEEKKENNEEEVEEDYEPSWEIEERPELMLTVDDSEITSEDNGENDDELQASPGVLPRPLPPSGPSKQQSSPRTPQEDFGGDPTDFLSGTWAGTGQGSKEDSRTFLEAHRSRREWTWAEARGWREWRARQEQEVRQRRAHLTTLVLQLERITPTIKSLLQEFDGQVMALVDSRVATDEALMLYQVVASSLHRRLARQDILNDTLKGLQQQRQQVEEKVKQALAEEANTRREEGRAKARQEKLHEQLKEEEVVLRRALINLPIDQYNHLLALYSKRIPGGGRHLDLPTGKGEGGLSGPSTPLHHPHSPSSPSRNMTVSPATPEKLAAGRRGSVRPSRPPSSTSHSDDFRATEESMPEGLAGGTRTWRLFLRHRRRRQELLDELDDAAAKRSSASAHLQAMDARRTQLLKEAKKLEEEVALTTEELRQVDEDAEVVLVLRGRQVKIDLLTMTQHLTPDFSHACLVKDEELRRLEATAEKCIESEGKEGTGREGEGEEVEMLRTLKGQLQLEVELARQDLHHINTFKVGRDVISAAAEGEGGQRDPSHLYASLQRLQQLQSQRAEGAAAASSKVDRDIRRSRRRVAHLQRQVDDLAREIDELQAQVTQVQPEAHLAKQETRLRRVMACNDLSAQVKQRSSTILDLQGELDTLRLRTFPMLSRPTPPPTL